MFCVGIPAERLLSSHGKVLHINGFISVNLEPTQLLITPGDTIKGTVNISLSQTYLKELEIHYKNYKLINTKHSLNVTNRKKEMKGNTFSQENNIDKSHTHLYIVSSSNATQESYISRGKSSTPDNGDSNGLDDSRQARSQNTTYNATHILSLLKITSCCEDKMVAQVVSIRSDVTGEAGSKSFSLIVKGISLGRTSVKFMVERKRRLSFTEQLVNSTESQQDQKWWLPQEYHIIVTNRNSLMGFYLYVIFFGEYSSSIQYRKIINIDHILTMAGTIITKSITQLFWKNWLRPPTGVPNDIPTPSCKTSFISEQFDILILEVYIAFNLIIRLHELKSPGKEIIKATNRGKSLCFGPRVVALKERYIAMIT